MKPETIDTITRHLKGIVAALEKEKSEQRPSDELHKKTSEIMKDMPFMPTNDIWTHKVSK